MTEAWSRSRLILAALLLTGMVLVLAGCDQGPRVRFVDEQGVYTLAQVGENAAKEPAGESAEVDVADAAAVRKRMLSGLRRQGSAANEAADLLTSEFPTVTKSLPFYVEAAAVDGKRCWIVVEAWGGREGKLTLRRLWVFERDTKAIVQARTFR